MVTNRITHRPLRTTKILLEGVAPDIAAQWHPTKNGSFKVQTAGTSDATKVWWECSKGHEWQVSVVHRVRTHRRKGGSPCPTCSGSVRWRIRLAERFPDLAAEFHSDNEGDPHEMSCSERAKVKWCCPKGHEYEASVHQRVSAIRKGVSIFCHECKFRERSIGVRAPDLAAEFHTTKNGELTAFDVKAVCKTTLLWWECSEGHEWQSVPRQRRQCPECPRQLRNDQTPIFKSNPLLAQDWHSDNPPIERFSEGSTIEVKWRCSTCSHVWSASPKDRQFATRHRELTCPVCVRRLAAEGDRDAKLTLRRMRGQDRLIYTHPEMASQLHPTKNRELFTAETLSRRSNALVWWRCSKGHEWQERTKNRTRSRVNRTKKNGLTQTPDPRTLGECPECLTQQPPSEPAYKFVGESPFAQEWADKKPAATTLLTFKGRSRWVCPQGHAWWASPSERLEGKACYVCERAERRSHKLRDTHPDSRPEWHSTKNGELSFDEAVPYRKYWWQCVVCQTEWQAGRGQRIGARRRNKSGCPRCQSLGVLCPDLVPEWHSRNSTSIYAIGPTSTTRVWWRCDSGHEWQASPGGRTVANEDGSYDVRRCKTCPIWGLAVIREFVASIIPYLSTFTAAELQVLFDANGFSNAWRSKHLAQALLDGRLDTQDLEPFVGGLPSSVDSVIPSEPGGRVRRPCSNENLPVPRQPRTVQDVVGPSARRMHTIETDTEAVEELIWLAVVKLWKVAFEDESQAIEDARGYRGDEYALRICDQFLAEYEAVKALPVPEGYSFAVSGELTQPNLMQRLVAWQVQKDRRRGNWSGTGAGKTNSGIYASRVVGAQFTVVTCPNNVVDMWESAITAMYPDSQVATKTFEPLWSQGSGPRYLILNYERFQSDEAPSLVDALASQGVDFIIIDEIQSAKQRYEDQMSKRRYAVGRLVQEAGKLNSELCVLGMSATPVINSLREGTSLIELITSEVRDWPIRATVTNCVALHREFLRLGIRWVPDYDVDCEERQIDVPCDYLMDEIRALGSGSTPLALEQILTRARLPVILANLKPKTVIYTHNVTEVVDILERAIRLAGWRTGRFTGEDKSGLHGFLHGNLDVLIASSAITLGIDGIQHVCNHAIINVLPWTSAEFDQFKGRFYRQGQTRKTEIIIPVAFATIGGHRWSWCDGKLARIHFKRTIGDAVADGVVPRQQLLTAAQANKHVMDWLRRLDALLKKDAA